MADSPQVQIAEGMIHLGLGQPSASLLPLKIMEKAAAQVLSGKEASFLAYGAARGNPDFRQTLAEFLWAQTQVKTDSDQLLITNGNSQALELICTQYTNPGDTVLVEAPTYFLALRIFADHGLNIVTVPTDENGLIPEALEEILKTCSPAFLYCIPFFNNPASMTLPVQRQEQLAGISARHNLRVVSDEVYWFLHFKEPPPPSLGRFAGECPMICLGSFSKILAPGLRLGWLHAHPKTLKPISRSGLLQSGGGFNPFTSAIVNQVIQTGELLANIQRLNQVYSARSQLLCQELEQVLPDSVTFKRPRGGYFIWLKFPDDLDTQALRKIAQKALVDFFPGPCFSPEKKLNNYMRLSFAFYGDDKLIEGAQRLGRVIRRHNLHKE